MVEKQRDAKNADAAAWAARLQEVQEDCNNQMSYQQIEIQVSGCCILFRIATFAQLSSSFSQALHQRSHDLSQQLQVPALHCSRQCSGPDSDCRRLQH
jgi:hypothetical protein